MFSIMFVLLKTELWNILSDVKGDVNQVTCPDLQGDVDIRVFPYFFFLSLVYFEDVCSVRAVFLDL